jgi:tripartite-type tricarboxylate transporter receptor subunit TctC
MFDPVVSSIEHIRSGSLRPLAVTATKPTELLPGVAPVADFVPGYEASSMYGLGAPRNTPADIVDKLNAEINSALADPRMKARVTDMGGATLASSPAQFAAIVAAEVDKWGKVVKFSGAKPD